MKYQDLNKEELLKIVEKQEEELKRKYGLFWDREKEPEQVVLDCENNLPILERVTEKEIKTTEDDYNILIEGDNYHTLTVLNYTHKEKIDVIYIDPPYNTGNKDFIYNDRYVDKEDGYRHSKWLNFMEKRLNLAKRLLKKNGLFVVSIDDNELAQLKLLMDKIFDEKTKIVTVKMSEASGLKMGAVKKSGTIPKYKEYLVFAKLDGINNLFFDLIKKDKWDNEYNIFLDNFSKEDKDALNSYQEKLDLDNNDLAEVDKILKKITTVSVNEKIKELKFKKDEEINNWKFKNAWRIVRTAASSSVKSIVDEKKSKVKQQFISVLSKRDNILYIAKTDYSASSKQPRVQVIFAEDNLLSHPGDLWTDIKTTGLEGEGGITFKNGKKPIDLIKRIIKANNNKNSLILDFFAGSGSTGHAVLDLNMEDNGNRKFILCTYNEENGTQVKIAEEFCYPRIKNVIKGYNNKTGLNGNLQYFKTNFIKRTNSRDQVRFDLTNKCTEMLCVKDNIFSLEKEAKNYKIFSSNDKKRFLCVYYSFIKNEVSNFISDIKKLNGEKNIYMFSDTKQVDLSLFQDIENTHIEAVPEPILEIYRDLIKLNISK